MRVTPEQAAVFAAYDEQDAATVWYRADTKLLVTESADSRNDEFIWLRDLALDLTDERWSHAETQAALLGEKADRDHECRLLVAEHKATREKLRALAVALEEEKRAHGNTHDVLNNRCELLQELEADYAHLVKQVRHVRDFSDTLDSSEVLANCRAILSTPRAVAVLRGTP
jgi:hypothetical protein